MKYTLPIILLLLLPAVLSAQLIPSSFKTPVMFTIPDQGTGASANLLEVADMDGDGKTDIVSADGFRGDIYIFRNLHSGGVFSSNSFTSRIDLDFATTFYISGTALADIDGDGRTDILFSNSTTPCNNNSFGVLRNNSLPGSLGASDFGAPVFFEAGGCQSDITVADMDGDDKMDVIVVAPFSVSVLRNTSTPGAISFAAPVSMPTTNDIRARLHASDVDTDGKPDILVGYSTDSGNDSISIYRNTSSRGAIALAPRQDIFIRSDSRPWHIKTFDFDGDAKKEVVIANQFGGVSIMKNNSTPGNLNLIIQAGFDQIGEINSSLTDIQLADLDQDGFVDVIGADPGRANIGVVRTTSRTIDSTMFDDPVSFGAPIGTAGGYTDIKIADINADRLPDIIIMRRDHIAVYENRVRKPPVITSLSAYKGSAGEVITIRGDHFDAIHDNNIVLFGQVKAATISGNTNSITVQVPLGASLDEVSVITGGLTAVSSRKFVPTFDGASLDASSFAGTELFATTGFFSNTLELSDLDSDGKPDVVVSTGNIEFFKNTSNPGAIDQNTLTAQPTILLGVSSVNTIGLGDLTGDSKADILRNSSSAPGIFQNLSTGVEPTPFGFGGSIGSGVSTNDAVVGIPAGDLNLDGKLDLLYLGGGVNRRITIVENLQRSDTLGTQNIQDFSITPNPFTLLSGIAITYGGAFAADLDLDGKTDVGVVSQSENLLRIFRNDLQPGQKKEWIEKFVGLDLPADGTTVAMETIDLDDDGQLEIISTSIDTDQISVYPNQSSVGALSFGTKFSLSTLADPTQIESADLNGDGYPDLICVYNSLQQISVFPHLGVLPLSATSFGARIDYTLPATARDIAIGDIDLDGKPDILVGFSNQNNIGILKNQTSSITRITIDQQPAAQSTCAGENAIFSIQASGTSNLQYQWQVDEGSGFVDITDNATYSGSQTNELTIINVTLALDDNLYRCVVSGDNAALVNSNSAILNVNSVAVPAIIASGPLSFCEGENVILSGPDGFAEYQWSTGATTQDIPVSATGSFTLQVGDGRCLSDSSLPIEVTVNAVPDQPAITISGNNELCDGEQVTLLGPDGFDVYQWSNGGSTQSISITTTQSVTLVVGIQGCLSPASAPVTITVNDVPGVPEIIASGPTDICRGESVVLSGLGGYSSYLWSNGESTQSITVSSTLTATLIVSDSNCPSPSSEPVNVTVSERPDQPQIAVVGETEICEGEQTTLSGPAGFDLYQWSNGETTRSISVNNSAILTLVVGNGGCLSIPSESVTINAIDTPETPIIIISGDTEFCEGESVNLSGPDGFAIYEWSNGATTQSTQVSSSSSITLRVGDGACLSPLSETVVVSVFENPSTPEISVSGSTVLCDGDEVSLSAPVGYDTYLWSNGEATQSIVVGSAGSYNIIVANGPCISNTSEPVIVEVQNAPEVPEISVQGSFLFASSDAAEYQWYNKGEKIDGATSPYLELDLFKFGNYTVEVWNGSCSQTSLPFTLILTALEDLPSAQRPKIFPVPFEHELSVTNLEEWIGAHMAIYGIGGQRYFETKLDRQAEAGLYIDATGMRPGVYVVLFQKNEHVYWHKIVKN